MIQKTLFNSKISIGPQTIFINPKNNYEIFVNHYCENALYFQKASSRQDLKKLADDEWNKIKSDPNIEDKIKTYKNEELANKPNISNLFKISQKQNITNNNIVIHSSDINIASINEEIKVPKRKFSQLNLKPAIEKNYKCIKQENYPHNLLFERFIESIIKLGWNFLKKFNNTLVVQEL